jgi:hypothetical protein
MPLRKMEFGLAFDTSAQMPRLRACARSWKNSGWLNVVSGANCGCGRP